MVLVDIVGRHGFLGTALQSQLRHNPESKILVNCAARVGGIEENRDHPSEMFRANLESAFESYQRAITGKKKLIVNFGSTCAYSPESRVPFQSKDYLKGDPEVTNAGYAEAKRAIYRMGKFYGIRSLYLVMPNLYGPGDKSSHVIPEIISKVYLARQKSCKVLKMFGTGRAEREFLFVDDAAKLIKEAIIQEKSLEPVHLTSGQTITIRVLAETICRLMDYDGKLEWDKTKPDGQIKRKLERGRQLENPTRMEDGLKWTIGWFERSVY